MTAPSTGAPPPAGAATTTTIGSSSTPAATTATAATTSKRCITLRVVCLIRPHLTPCHVVILRLPAATTRAHDALQFAWAELQKQRERIGDVLWSPFPSSDLSDYCLRFVDAIQYDQYVARYGAAKKKVESRRAKKKNNNQRLREGVGRGPQHHQDVVTGAVDYARRIEGLLATDEADDVFFDTAVLDSEGDSSSSDDGSSDAGPSTGGGDRRRRRRRRVSSSATEGEKLGGSIIASSASQQQQQQQQTNDGGVAGQQQPLGRRRPTTRFIIDSDDEGTTTTTTATTANNHNRRPSHTETAGGGGGGGTMGGAPSSKNASRRASEKSGGDEGGDGRHDSSSSYDDGGGTDRGAHHRRHRGGDDADGTGRRAQASVVAVSPPLQLGAECPPKALVSRLARSAAGVSVPHAPMLSDVAKGVDTATALAAAAQATAATMAASGAIAAASVQATFALVLRERFLLVEALEGSESATRAALGDIFLQSWTKLKAYSEKQMHDVTLPRQSQRLRQFGERRAYEEREAAARVRLESQRAEYIASRLVEFQATYRALVGDMVLQYTKMTRLRDMLRRDMEAKVVGGGGGGHGHGN